MQFPQDAGLSCVRYYLVPRDPELEALAKNALAAPGKHVGSLICQCGEVNQWKVSLSEDGARAMLFCSCNGSSLPIYIGSPTQKHMEAKVVVSSHRCLLPLKVVIAIGYPKEVPPLGSIAVEVAQELVMAAFCSLCKQSFIRWHLTLAAPPVFQGNEPWLTKIQGYKERPFWSTLTPQEQAKHPDAPPNMLWSLAKRFPKEVLQNIVLPLIAIESPEQWKQIRYQALTSQYTQELKELTENTPKKVLAEWRHHCAMRIIERYTPQLTPEARREQEEFYRSSTQEKYFQKVGLRVGGSHNGKANDASRQATDMRRPPEERAALYQEAATELILHSLSEPVSQFDFAQNAAKAASYIASSSGHSPEEAYIEEYQWMLELLTKIKEK
jgi:hypothetical protein